LTDMTLRWFGLPTCSASPEGLPPSPAQQGSCGRSSTSPSLPVQDAHPLDLLSPARLSPGVTESLYEIEGTIGRGCDLFSRRASLGSADHDWMSRLRSARTRPTRDMDGVGLVLLTGVARRLELR
jgi:hypothetical protein